MDILTLTLAVQKALAQLGVSIENHSVVITAETPVQIGENVLIGSSPLVAGNAYKVTLNGKVYPCVAFSGNFGKLGERIAIGNKTVLDEVTGEGEYDAAKEPFVIVDMTADGSVAFACLPKEAGAISISYIAETIHPIDPKFLPPVDSITMNGADGKQYKLTVNNGAISVTEVV